jgi:pimeloyl-ACP methyl ester carboxylesterase
VSTVRREQLENFSLLHRPARGEPRATVHFAHATGFNAYTYRQLLEALDPSLEVYAMDARGHGLSSAPADPKKLRSWAPFRRDLEAFVETLSRPTVLAGHSMGATVSMELAAKRPDLVQGLVLIDPVIVPPKRVVLFAVARLLGISQRLIPIAQAAARRRTEFSSRQAAVENYEGKGAFKTWPRAWIEDYVEGGTVETASGNVRLSCDRGWESRTFANSTVNPYPALRRVRCPMTLLTRKPHGPPFPRESRDAFMKNRPKTRLVELENASHFLVMERPGVVQAEIERMALQLG